MSSLFLFFFIYLYLNNYNLGNHPMANGRNNGKQIKSIRFDENTQRRLVTYTDGTTELLGSGNIRSEQSRNRLQSRGRTLGRITPPTPPPRRQEISEDVAHARDVHSLEPNIYSDEPSHDMNYVNPSLYNPYEYRSDDVNYMTNVNDDFQTSTPTRDIISDRDINRAFRYIIAKYIDHVRSMITNIFRQGYSTLGMTLEQYLIEMYLHRT
jgi:hypothetical protein